MQTRLIIAEDHNLVREGIRRILQNSGDVLVVGEARDGEEAVQMAAALRPDVVLMDISMPGLNGIEATKRIKDQLPSTAVLVLTAHDESPLVVTLLEAGAKGYLLKTAYSEELIGAVRTVRAGGTVLSRTVSPWTLGTTGRSPGPPTGGDGADRLTDREMEVLRLVAKGLTNKAIAGQLRLSSRTVQVHLYRVFAKLGVASRTEAVVAAMERGWLHPERGS